MRKTKKIRVDNKEITVKELTVRELLSFFEEGETLSLETLGRLLEVAADGLDMEGLKDMAPGDIKLVWEGFREVNAVFFDTARALGVDEAVAGIRKSLVSDFCGLLASS
ncbi:MAG: hypothetical protein B1H12_04695 [Desulfobacteraceae bacterium 4484_190.2]|nr:MAG: hypothetical protein B1H12_04695 [Desulfobacteraceae bacterium 4484_190.2]